MPRCGRVQREPVLLTRRRGGAEKRAERIQRRMPRCGRVQREPVLLTRRRGEAEKLAERDSEENAKVAAEYRESLCF
jgi:hypothetical protein